MLVRYKIQCWLEQHFTQYCVLCRQANNATVCIDCMASIPRFNHPQLHYNLMRWPKIIEALRPNTLSQLHAFGDYEYPVSYWLKQLKFERKLIYSEVLADLFVHSIRNRENTLPDALVPAPLHPSRYIQRQFNQARILGQSIGYRLNIPVIDCAIIRTNATQAQSQLKRQQRLDNVLNAFTSIKLSSSIGRVAIVDDVITTGSTMQAMLNAFRHSNPNVDVEVWSIAVALSSLDKLS